MREEYLNSDEEKIVLPEEKDGVDPLAFQDIEGGLYLLGGGYFVSILVHVILILKVKIQNLM